MNCVLYYYLSNEVNNPCITTKLLCKIKNEWYMQIASRSVYNVYKALHVQSI